VTVNETGVDMAKKKKQKNVITEESVYIHDFIKHMYNDDYANAMESLRSVVVEKMKARIRDCERAEEKK
jgi:hypothetical protein